MHTIATNTTIQGFLMTILKKITPTALIITLMTTTTIMSMKNDCPQLGLQEKTNTVHIIKGNLLICSSLQSMYRPFNSGNNLLTESNFQASLGMPFIPIKTTNNLNLFRYIPAKTLYNCNDKSRIVITTPKKTYDLICIKNEYLPGKTFLEQYTIHMKKFYGSASFNKDFKRQLIDTGIIKKETVRTIDVHPFYINSYGTAFTPLNPTITMYHHGPNGCPNEKRFIEKTIEPHTKLYNNSMHQFVIWRQYGNKDYGRKPQPNNTETPIEELVQHEFTLSQTNKADNHCVIQ